MIQEKQKTINVSEEETRLKPEDKKQIAFHAYYWRRIAPSQLQLEFV